ncbi:hypothetical protein [Niallia sp. Man26]|nr:hypothetical protein [Niallia sp. Man26]UPO90728.1 hypothetical protein L8T27_022045 [Niallia sp. Man26]
MKIPKVRALVLGFFLLFLGVAQALEKNFLAIAPFFCGVYLLFIGLKPKK